MNYERIENETPILSGAPVGVIKVDQVGIFLGTASAVVFLVSGLLILLGGFLDWTGFDGSNWYFFAVLVLLSIPPNFGQEFLTEARDGYRQKEITLHPSDMPIPVPSLANPTITIDLSEQEIRRARLKGWGLVLLDYVLFGSVGTVYFAVSRRKARNRSLETWRKQIVVKGVRFCPVCKKKRGKGTTYCLKCKDTAPLVDCLTRKEF